MKRFPILIVILVATIFQQLAAKPLLVTEQNLQIPSDSTLTLWYGFAAGDKIEISMSVEHDLHLSSFEVTEYPSTPRLSQINTPKVKSKTLIADRTGIYRFSLSNKMADSRTVKLQIKRNPVDNETDAFSTSVNWRTQQDTTYTAIQEKYLIQSDTLVQQIYSANPVIPSKSMLGTKNFQVLEFTLPKNTVSWSFYIGTGEEGQKSYESTTSKYSTRLASIVSRIPEYGPLAALALTGVSYFSTNIQGEDNIKYWFLNDGNDAQNFKLGQKFHYYKRGDVMSEASQMRNPQSGPVYLAVLNDNMIESVKLTLRIAAIEVNQKWGIKNLQQMKVNTVKVPYLAH